MKINGRTIVFRLLAIAMSLVIAAPAAADPLPGEILRFSQLPMDGVTLPTGTGAVQQYWGHD